MVDYNNPYTIRPRVFVSSVIEGFQEYREAARRAIESAGGEPILVNEDFPSLADSPRNACLDAVDSADVFVLVVGARGGWQAPSGKLVIEEEYGRALSGKLPVFAFVQDTKLDAQAQEFADKISEYIGGLFRVTFKTSADLYAKIKEALGSEFCRFEGRTMDKNEIILAMQNPYSIPNEVSIHFTLVPERREEVIDPITLGSEDFIQRIFELGHSKDVGLFSYSRQKEHSVKTHSLVIHQFDPLHARKETVEEALLELAESGQIVIDTNITRRIIRGQRNSMLDSLVVAYEDVEMMINRCFRFVGALFDYIDEFKRHQRFLYNLSLVNMRERKLMKNPKEQGSYQLNMPGHDKPIIAFDEPRLVSRQDLYIPKNEIERSIAVLSRKI